MVNVQDVNLAALVVNAISDAVFTASRPPQALEGSLQRRADATWFLAQRAADELGSRKGGRHREAVAQCSPRTWRQNHSERFRLGNFAVWISLLMRLVHEPAAVP
ncbi:MAG: hypothetical protein QOE61_2157 [Micromonosporaceae bacterium]|jgi:hypothetical protein|nr:hypothetical protein [Micromonosporaceae bacterium]